MASLGWLSFVWPPTFQGIRVSVIALVSVMCMAWQPTLAAPPDPLELLEASRDRSADADFTLTDADRNHWAFQPLRVVEPPTVRRSTATYENAVDRFVLAKLAAAGLSFAPRASPTVLIRRVTLDLIGLPPTPAEIDAYVNDPSPCAYEHLIDRLLASPHYGERWGRHWLDLARYAETDGFEHDAVRPHSWRYRDYVIKAFNDDQPYDRFIREQLAGDELWPDDTDAITATGFNLLGPDMVDSSDQIQRRHNTLNDMTDTTALVFLGLTLGCARCHDHKFEPISQRDYYCLQAFFTPAKFNREKAIPTPLLRASYDAAMREYNEHPKIRELAALEAPVREKLFENKVTQLSAEAQIAHRTPPEQRNAQQANLVLETGDQVKILNQEVAATFNEAMRQRHARLHEEVKNVPRPIPLPKAMALGTSGGPPVKTFVLHRGEYDQPGEEAKARFPTVLTHPTALLDAGIAVSASGARDTSAEVGLDSAAPSSRAALANWIGSQQNPLTARVMVNRVWQHHFGRGVVPTPSNFGTHGQAPTHPELLDWLANEFITCGWSVKQMHALILTSATYRQVSVLSQNQIAEIGDDQSLLEALNPASITTHGSPNIDDSAAWKLATRSDPDNRHYWRMNRLRLEGEVIRDGLLAVSGQLNPALGGPGVFPPIPKELFAGAQGWSTTERASDYNRRSIYIFARRNLRFPFLEVFDAPDSNMSCPVREMSTTAPQSLALLNADEVTTAAKVTATRLKHEWGAVEERIGMAYRLALGRAPTARERTLAREFLLESPLDELCRALFNLNDFVYVE